MDNRIDALNFVILHVSNMEGETAFYTDKLGFEVEAKSPGFVQFKQSPGGAIFALLPDENPQPLSGVELWWTVADTDAVYDQLRQRDVEIVSPPTDQPFGRTLSIKDPAGNTLNMFRPA